MCTDAVAKKSPCGQINKKYIGASLQRVYPQRSGPNLPLPIDRLTWIFNVGTLARCSHSIRRSLVMTGEKCGTMGSPCTLVEYLLPGSTFFGDRNKSEALETPPKWYIRSGNLLDCWDLWQLCHPLRSTMIRACRLPEYPSRMLSTFFYVYYEARLGCTETSDSRRIRQRLSQVDEQGL